MKRFLFATIIVSFTAAAPILAMAAFIAGVTAPGYFSDVTAALADEPLPAMRFIRER